MVLKDQSPIFPTRGVEGLPNTETCSLFSSNAEAVEK